MIDDRTGILGTLRREILEYDGKEKELSTTEDGSELYDWLRTTADNLLTS
ncbi:hypothetical protein QU020_004431 [Salmonella enterica]|nr:hypothetical protein [Salmonella enterica]